jgi:hypothetical protein
LWPAILLLSVYPALVLVRVVRRYRRPKPGHCGCGYNLTGNTTGICPECGTVVPAQDSTSAR